MRGVESKDSRFFANPDCGICSGSPLGDPCRVEMGEERLDLPALAHADTFCTLALMRTLERTPTRIRKTSTHHSWQLIDAAINISRAHIYKNNANEWFGLAFGIAREVEQRPYEGAYEQIQSRKILSYEPMFRDQYLHHGQPGADAIIATSRRLGRLLRYIDGHQAEYYEYEETGVAANQSTEIELAYLGLRAGIQIYPASTRQDNSPIKRHNFDLYVHPSQNFTPIQVRNSGDPRTYDPTILTIDYPKFRRDVMSRSSKKESQYSDTVRDIIIDEAHDVRDQSASKLRPLNTATNLLRQMITAHRRDVA